MTIHFTPISNITMDTGLLLVCIFSILLEGSHTIKIYNINGASCRLESGRISVLEKYEFSGQLIFEGSADTNVTECSLTVGEWQPRPQQIMFYFDYLDIPGDTGSCNDSFLEVFDGSDESVREAENKFCGNVTPTGVFTGSQLNTVFRFRSEGRGTSSRWGLTFTSFHTGHCTSYEYACTNGRCINHALNCNGYNPCGDFSDCRVTPGALACIAIGAVCAISVGISVMYLIYRQRKLFNARRRQRTFEPAIAFENPLNINNGTVTILTSPPPYTK